MILKLKFSVNVYSKKFNLLVCIYRLSIYFKIHFLTPFKAHEDNLKFVWINCTTVTVMAKTHTHFSQARNPFFDSKVFSLES